MSRRNLKLNWCQDLDEIGVETDRTGIGIRGRESQPRTGKKKEGKAASRVRVTLTGFGCKCCESCRDFLTGLFWEPVVDTENRFTGLDKPVVDTHD